MMRKNLYLMFQIILGFVIYSLLASVIDNMFVLLAIIITLGVIIIVARTLYIRNEADVLEVLVNPPKHFDNIKKYENRDPNKYKTLLAYGLTYSGDFEEAQSVIDTIYYKDIKTSRNLHYSYYATKLHLAYNNKDRELYGQILNAAKELEVFKKVNVPESAFDAHLLLLEGQSERAEELLKNVIPIVKKRILVVELEYLLALAYLNQGNITDCKAICEFVIEKNYPVVHSALCKELIKNTV